MRTMKGVKHVLRFLAVALFAAEAAAEGMAPDDVLSGFRQYESLNEAFVSAQDCPCKSEPLREELEKYADGPLEQALGSAVQMICDSGNAEVLRGLLHVTLATFETGSESPARSLGRAFVCRPELVTKEFKALQPPLQRSLFEILGIGFENAVYDHPEAHEVVELRERLQSLAPESF